jgi:HSP20 family molecular chaperone IbpA
VSRDRLNVSTDQKNLIVEGRAQINMPEGMTALYADVRSTLYRRSFALNGELMETDKIEASLKDGVLTLRIPKQSELRPRKIEVRVS